MGSTRRGKILSYFWIFYIKCGRKTGSLGSEGEKLCAQRLYREFYQSGIGSVNSGSKPAYSLMLCAQAAWQGKVVQN